MNRLTQAWRALGREQRLAAVAALGLFISMLLPWYSKTNTFVEHNAAKASQQSLSAFQAFSFVEAAVLLVSAGVLAILFARAEQRDFQLPGGDGLIVMVAGGWAALLIFYRMLDKPSLQGTQRITATVGVEWGIFIALLLALSLLYVGRLMRTSEHARPPRQRPRRQARGEDHERDEQAGRAFDDDLGLRSGAEESEQATAVTTARTPPRGGGGAQGARRQAGGRSGSRGRPRFPPAPSEQMSFEDDPPERE